MDVTACNYNPEAQAEDFTCEYPAEGFDCEGNCTTGETLNVTLSDSYGDGWNGNVLSVNGIELTPLTTSAANVGTQETFVLCYDSSQSCIDVTCDGGEWQVEVSLDKVVHLPDAIGECGVLGCTDPLAPNYNADATDEDGSCEFYCAEGEAILSMVDSYGDSWNGNELIINDVAYTVSFDDNGGDFNTVCVPVADCYIFGWTSGSYVGETSWTLSLADTVLSGSAGSYPTAYGDCGVLGCTDLLHLTLTL